MSEQTASKDAVPYDAIVIGAGICGIIFLKYAQEKGLNCLVLEKQSDVGGLWNQLPTWQDIQNRKNDFAINDVPLNGVRQPAVHEHIRTWVDKYQLSPFIRLQTKVNSVSWHEDHWLVDTDENVFKTRYVIAASGVQNKAWIPEINRQNSAITELHSSAIHKPEELAQKRVTVVGGGASGWDLLDMALEQGAEKIRWVYRNTRWFSPSTRSKQDNPMNDLRVMSRAQVLKKDTRGVSAFIRKILKKKYSYFELEAIEPKEEFDLDKHQVIPGRPLMIKNQKQISRYQTEIKELEGNRVILKNGQEFETDVILWATGYRMNLEYLGLPEYSNIKTLKELYPRLGSLVRSMDYPNLFFVGMSLLESSSSTPFFAAVEAKSIVAHIQGKCEIPNKNIPTHVVHWDLFPFFASFDKANYPRFWWRFKYFFLPWWYAAFPKKQLKI